MNYKNMMQQAQEMQAKMMAFQESLQHIDVEGTSGGGLVKLCLSGKGSVHRIEIDPSLLKPEEKEVLEDLLAAAFTDARQKMEKRTSEEMAKITGGLQLPDNFKMPGF